MAKLGFPRRKTTWEQVQQLLTTAVPGATFGHDPSWVAWHEGPSISSVHDAVAPQLTGWQWRAVAPALEPSIPPALDEPTVWVRRSYSLDALAVAHVRFRGAHGRTFTTADERGRDAFARLLDVDDPARSGYAIVDTIAEAVLAEHQRGTGDDVDELAATLDRLGYDRLWAKAFAAAP